MGVVNGTVPFRKLHLVRLRIGKLDDTGKPDPGAANMYVTDQQISLGISKEFEAGDDLTQKNGEGIACITYKTRDTYKRSNLTLSFCMDEPELNQMLAGGTLLTSGGTTVGYAEPAIGEVGNVDGVGIEAWVKNITGGALDATYPYLRYVLPRAFFQMGDETLENGIIVTNFTGFAVENSNWGNGPANDWTHISTRVSQRAGDTDLPTPSIGALALAAS